MVSAVSFLLKNKFRFDLPFSDGITYLSRKEERRIRASWAARDAERAAIEDMILKVEDKPLNDHIHLSVQKWLSQPLAEREGYLNIPHTTKEEPRTKLLPAVLNRYQIRLTHQIIRKDYANLKTVGRDGFVRITIRNEKEDSEEKLRLERYREQDVIHAVEFRWLIEALCGGDISKIPDRCFLAAMSSDVKPNEVDFSYKGFVDELQHKLRTRRRVLFGHNCFTDLVYLYACFIGDPPEKVEDFQELIHELFPAVVDTKYLASLVKELRFNSNLETLEKEMRTEELPRTEVPAAYDRYVWGENYHEAGFDSFMTAKIAIKLSAKLEREEKLREAIKPQRIVKAGETILMDATVDAEDDEQIDEYVTAPESVAETESVMSALATKASTVFLAADEPVDVVTSPLAGQKSPAPASQGKSEPHLYKGDIETSDQERDETACESALPLNDDSIPSNEDAKLDTSLISTPVVVVKEKVVELRNLVEVKQIKHVLDQNSLLDILDTPVGPKTESSRVIQGDTESASKESDGKNTPQPDLLIWIDKEEGEGNEEDEEKDGEGRSGESASQGIEVEDEIPETKMTAQELEERVNDMAAKGEMMPRWDSESGIWNVIGNKLVVNACEEGVCILWTQSHRADSV